MDRPVMDEIMDERRRQISVEGWSLAHDDEWRQGQLVFAAISYAVNTQPFAADQFNLRYAGGDTITRFWPWGRKWWKPKNPREDLIRAAALIVAEIERLDRQSIKGEWA